jgi:hypothetical protein
VRGANLCQAARDRREILGRYQALRVQHLRVRD